MEVRWLILYVWCCKLFITARRFPRCMWIVSKRSFLISLFFVFFGIFAAGFDIRIVSIGRYLWYKSLPCEKNVAENLYLYIVFGRARNFVIGANLDWFYSLHEGLSLKIMNETTVFASSISCRFLIIVEIMNIFRQAQQEPCCLT